MGMVKIIMTIVVTVICAFLYRFGGCSKEEGKKKYPWAPSWMISSWVRDWGCTIFSTLWMLICYPHVPWFVYIVSAGMMGGMISTYKILGKTNFWFHGFMIGASYAWFPMFTGLWIGFVARCLAMAVLAGGISAASGNVDVEELGRGGAIGITLPLMLI